MENSKIGLLIVCLLLLGVISFGMHRKNPKSRDLKNEIIAASIRYTGCYGHCKEYSIGLNKEGIVTYTGIRFAKDSGVYNRKIDITEASRILHLFEVYRVDTCMKRYPNRVPDLPAMIFEVKYTDTTKRIMFANYGPVYFMELAGELERVGEKDKLNDGWEKVTPGKN